MANCKENYFTYGYTVEGLNIEISVKDYLMDHYAYSSRLMRQIKREGEIKVGNRKVTPSYLVNNGDEIIVFLGLEHLDSDPEEIPLKIVHEDEDILVVDKQPLMVTHATRSHPQGTLANAIANHWMKGKVNAKIRFVNRLDRDTSGIIIIAKNKYAHQFIQNEMKEDRVDKIYFAIVEGIPQIEEGTINAPIGRPNEEAIIREIMENGQEAITHYLVLEKFEHHALLQIKIDTGRTHQIRVHLKSIGHPIIGDNLYNEDSMKYIQRQALHAGKISFVHSRLQRKVTYEAPLPEDMKEVIEMLRRP